VLEIEGTDAVSTGWAVGYYVVPGGPDEVIEILGLSDRLPRRRVDHAERDRFLSGRGGVESDRNEDKREP
jgi:hypothetical protein